MLPGKDYVAWADFEEVLKRVEMNERDFLARFRLGMYAVREWKRKGFAPYWAVEAARLCGQVPAVLADIPVSFIFAAMTPEEDAAWEAADNAGDIVTAEAIKAEARKRVKL